MDLLNDLEKTWHPASLGKRWTAAFIDFIFFELLHLLFFQYILDLSGNNAGFISALFFLILSFILPWFLVFPLLEGINNGKTIGKKLLEIRAAGPGGIRITFRKALIRHLFDWVDFLPFFGIVGLVTAFNSPDNQRVGDSVAKTIVIDG